MPFERIKALEVNISAMQEDMTEMRGSLKKIEEVVTEGRGAARLAKFLLFMAGVLAGGAAGHEKMSEFLKWLGS